MIDPTNITNYNLTDAELEEHILFWVTAAGKNGKTAARSLEKFLSGIKYNDKQRPFEAIRSASFCFNNFPKIMKAAGIGCHTHKSKTFIELALSNLNLRECTVNDLEKIYGIGMKTSRCFIIHSRKNAQYAGLDTHILKHLSANGVKDVPKQTPSSKKQYIRLEKEMLRLAKDAGMSPADYDLTVWNKYSIKNVNTA